MAIKSINKRNIIKTRVSSDIKDLESLEQELVEMIKNSISMLVHEDAVVDVKEYVEDLLLNWEDEEIEDEEED